VASACIDLSDGLADALEQMAAASGVGAEVDAGALPVEPGARVWFSERGVDPARAAAAGGDDYELLVAVRPRLKRQLAGVVRHARVPLTRIGVCTTGPGVTLDGALLSGGFRHFR
jgi:thiamine-monophosphate kinase